MMSPIDPHAGLQPIGFFFGRRLYVETSDEEEAREIERAFETAMQCEYTMKRRVYAWIGFCTIVALTIGLIAFLVWANIFINANL